MHGISNYKFPSQHGGLLVREPGSEARSAIHVLCRLRPQLSHPPRLLHLRVFHRSRPRSGHLGSPAFDASHARCFGDSPIRPSPRHHDRHVPRPLATLPGKPNFLPQLIYRANSSVYARKLRMLEI